MHQFRFRPIASFVVHVLLHVPNSPQVMKTQAYITNEHVKFRAYTFFFQTLTKSNKKTFVFGSMLETENLSHLPSKADVMMYFCVCAILYISSSW